MPNLLLFVVIALAVALLFVTLKALSLWYALTHTRKAPKGSLRIDVPAKQWDDMVTLGAVGVAITDGQGHVLMTVLIQKEVKS